MTFLETPRMIFRAHASEDLERYCAMEADPEVRQYVGGAPRAYSEAKRRFLAGLSSAEDPLALKAVVLKSEGNYIGRAGLYPHFGPGGPVPDEASISFYLARPYWGQGLATEAGAAFVRYGIDILRLARIVTTIDARNAASRRVLGKLGFRLFATEQGIREFELYELRASPHESSDGYGPIVEPSTGLDPRNL